MKKTRTKITNKLQTDPFPSSYVPASDTLRLWFSATGTGGAGDIPVIINVTFSDGSVLGLVVGTPARPYPFEIPADVIKIDIPSGFVGVFMELYEHGK